MRITEAEVIVCSPGRNFVTLKITTDDGVSGIGDATLNGRELAVAGYLTEHIVPLLIGRDAAAIEDTWQYLYHGAYWRRGPVTMSALSAVDMALWDIKGKALGVPVHQLLGGPSREAVLVYGHANGADIEETVAAVGRYLAMGYRAVRAQTGVPGLRGVYGVGRGELYYEPAEKGLPSEERWSTEKYLNVVPELFRVLRETYGHDVHLLHDGHHRMTPIQAAWLGQRLEDSRLFWLEDATPAEHQQSFRQLRSHTTTPLAVGEIFNSVHDCSTLIAEQLIDYIRTPPARAGGITGVRKIAGFAEVYGVRTGFHGATDLSPVAMAAALQVDLAIPNFGIQEYMRHTAETDAVFPHEYTFAEGFLHPGTAAGLGVEIDEEAAARYPYERAYLPVNRLEDGTVHPW
ncbi:D-mannonate dehydratase ManD [Sciscionella sediminilitoris]|uniref:D-mannonate dehydratase ManD n=1 Tax=Sciscionella sediminilitoris TaxID=1445613 RepID=UPI0004DF3433|nr:D-mannonate dehydratase ManD [Sciscionella sp. SE31]